MWKNTSEKENHGDKIGRKGYPSRVNEKRQNCIKELVNTEKDGKHNDNNNVKKRRAMTKKVNIIKVNMREGPREHVLLETRNVRSIYEIDKLKQLMEEVKRYKFDTISM